MDDRITKLYHALEDVEDMIYNLDATEGETDLRIIINDALDAIDNLAAEGL